MPLPPPPCPGPQRCCFQPWEIKGAWLSPHCVVQVLSWGCLSGWDARGAPQELKLRFQTPKPRCFSTPSGVSTPAMNILSSLQLLCPGAHFIETSRSYVNLFLEPKSRTVSPLETSTPTIPEMKITFSVPSPALLYTWPPKPTAHKGLPPAWFQVRSLQRSPYLLPPPARAGWTGCQGSVSEPSLPSPPGTSALTLTLYLPNGSRDWRAGL